MKELGFNDYIEEVNSVNVQLEQMVLSPDLPKLWIDVFAQEKPKKTRKSLDSSGLSQDELLKQQQELFARARNALKNSQDNLADPKRVT